MKHDYCYVKNLYSPEECVQIRMAIENNIFIGSEDLPADRSIKTAKVDLVKYGDIKNVIDKFHNYVLNINHKMFGFDIFQISDLELLNYNRYHSNDRAEYSWHKDAEKDQPFDLKLTAILDLSPDEYQGGEFSLFLDGPCEIAEFRGTGSMIIFPSWIVHRVSPVTQGTRISLSHFIAGPLLK